MRTTYLMPDAEHILELALMKAEQLVRAGDIDDAIRCLAVAVAAADLVHDSEVENLGQSSDWWDELDGLDGPTP
jgi:hypothetical protein